MKKIKKESLYILSLAFPIIIENILQTLLGTTDTYFAGQLTDAAIAGIGITNMIMNIFIAFFTAVSIGTTAIVSRNYGKGDDAQTTRAMIQSIIAGTVLGLSIGAICLVFCKPILFLAGADESVIAYAAHNIAGTIESYAYIPAMGFGMAIAFQRSVWLLSVSCFIFLLFHWLPYSQIQKMSKSKSHLSCGLLPFSNRSQRWYRL